MNKKGEEGIGLGTLLALALGIVAVVIIVIGFTTGFNWFFDLFGKSTIDVAFISQKCEQLASVGSAGYCSDSIEIATNSYVNCNYAVANLGAKITSVAPTICTIDEGKIAICKKLELELGDNWKIKQPKIKVNGEKCPEPTP